MVPPEAREICPLSHRWEQILLDHSMGIVRPLRIGNLASYLVEAVPQCGTIAVDLVHLPNLDSEAEIARALFHFLGFRAPWDSGRRVPMSDPLSRAWRPSTL